MSVSAASSAGSIQMAMLAKVLDQARPVPAASPSDAVLQAAASQALLASAARLDVLA